MDITSKRISKWSKDPSKMFTSFGRCIYNIWMLITTGITVYGCVTSLIQNDWRTAFFCALMALMLIWFLIRKSKDEQQTEVGNLSMGTRDLFLETLTKIGCQYEFAEEEGDNRIFFAYQGEHFFVNATNEGWYIHIYDTHWGHIELYDIEEFSRLKKAINGSNLNNSVMTVYTIDEAGSSVDVHCKSTILFIPQIPRIEDYLRLELNEFFRAHQYVGNEMARLRESEKSNA